MQARYKFLQPWVKLDTQSSSLARVEKKFGLILPLMKRKERDEKGLKSVKREKKNIRPNQGSEISAEIREKRVLYEQLKSWSGNRKKGENGT